MKLDIGCGDHPSGDVNIDRFLYVNALDRTSLRTAADIIADAQYLPIRSESFHEVFSAHVIEHLDSPIRLVREAERVCRKGGLITIRCPSRWDWGHRESSKKGFHKWTMTRTWFHKLGFSTTLSFSNLIKIPKFPLRLMAPGEIVATKVRS